MKDEKITEIKKVIDKIRPYIQRDGGDVEFPISLNKGDEKSSFLF